MKAKGHTVKIITGMPKVDKWLGPKDSNDIIRVGPSVRYGAMGTYTQLTLSPKVIKNFRKALKENNFDVLHIHGPCDFGLPMLAYKMFKGPKIATLHSAFKDSFSRKLISPFYKWVFKKSDAVIGVSQHAVNTMLRYARFDYHVIPNGVDVETFQQGKTIDAYNDGKKNILYIGRVEPRNGLDVLLQTLPLILKKNPNIRLLVGGGGPQLEEYKKLLSESEKEHVVFLGAVYAERPDLYKTADTFVLPNRFGGTFSIMILEALAAGTPIVSTPFVPENCRNDHWTSVIVSENYSPEALAKSVLTALSNDQTQRISQGYHIVKKYDWRHVADIIISIYEKCARQ
ncbi:glycosyltransferase family 4 protein [bacterium]|nr:glycosyltransferase family 4 protein [bacterium]